MDIEKYTGIKILNSIAWEKKKNCMAIFAFPSLFFLESHLEEKVVCGSFRVFLGICYGLLSADLHMKGDF